MGKASRCFLPSRGCNLVGGQTLKSRKQIPGQFPGLAEGGVISLPAALPSPAAGSSWLTPLGFLAARRRNRASHWAASVALVSSGPASVSSDTVPPSPHASSFL